MIESLACGTPVIAYNRGSVSEVIESGVNGYIVNSIEEAAKAVEKIDELSRLQCRQIFEERFSVSRMANDYRAIYEQLIDKGESPLKPLLRSVA